MSEKIIIENRTNLPMQEVLLYVMKVIERGRVSETSKGKHRSYVTIIFTDDVVVHVVKNRKSDRFIVVKEGEAPRNRG